MVSKKVTDIVMMVMTVCAIATGVKLHQEVHHLYVYDNEWLWIGHIVAGLIVTLGLVSHCIQHKFWFKRYKKISISRKWLTSLLFCAAILVTVSGLILALGSHSQFVSIFHFATAILFTEIGRAHV